MFPKPLEHTADFFDSFFGAIRYIVLIVQLVDVGEIRVIRDHIDNCSLRLIDERIQARHDRIQIGQNTDLQIVDGSDNIRRLGVAVVGLVFGGDTQHVSGNGAVALRNSDGRTQIQIRGDAFAR